jgi:hypothetical protein
MRSHIIDNKGNLIVKVGDRVENKTARFYIGAINESQELCLIDKDRPWELLDPSDPMAKCVEQGNYAATARTLSVIA